MGIVYRARHLSLDCIVAVKMLLFGPLASPEFVKRFRAEASAAASLQHPNIVAIHDVGVCQGQQYFAMDYVSGQSLAKLLANGPLPARRAASLTQDHCRSHPLRPRAGNPAPRPQAIQRAYRLQRPAARDGLWIGQAFGRRLRIDGDRPGNRFAQLHAPRASRRQARQGQPA